MLLKLHANLAGNDPEFVHALLSMLSFADEHGVAAAELSGFDFASRPPEARCYYLDAARRLAEQTPLPLILVGGLRDRADMQSALDAGVELVSPPEARCYYLDAARRLAEQTPLPLILVGGLRDRADMQSALDAGVELVSAARPFICQPDFIRIARAGGASACRGCYGCFRSYQTTGKRCVLHR